MMVTNIGDDTALIDANVRLSDSVFAWCVRNSQKCAGRGQSDRSIQWAIIAGEATDKFCASKFADETLEATLRGLGSHFDCRQSPTAGKKLDHLRWLHVLSCCYETGGHTALCRRWLELDASADVHSVALTFQGNMKIPDALRDVVANKGGGLHLLDASTSLLDRAKALKALSNQADVIVLHTHMWEPLPTIAFSTPGGPPVLLLNHADHTYWTGSSVADLILNIRPSGEALCRAHRGNSRSFRLPIPIPTPEVIRGDPSGKILREALGIPLTSQLFLTIGSAYKYIPTQDMNFFESAKNILARFPAGYLIAVGPEPNNPHWNDLAQQTSGRAIAVGPKTDLKPYFAAADVYLEGFPFGSLTALLEAILAGIPPILAPECCPLPFRSDDFALNSLKIPKNTDQYVQMAIDLGMQSRNKYATSDELKLLTTKIHCAPDWSKVLVDLRKIVVTGLQHEPSTLAQTERLSDNVLRYWARFARQRTGQDNVFGFAFRRAMEEKLNPRLDFKMFHALNMAKNSGLEVADPTKSYIASALLSLLPAKMANDIYFRV